jgi:hypothetical protein
MNQIAPRCPPGQLLLAGSLLLLPAIATSAAAASPIPLGGATIAVANCNDSGPGSLRSAVASAASGDTIDMTSLACRKIYLTSGAIEIAQHDLALVGGPPEVMKVDAERRSSVFRHLGTGTLYIKRLDISRGVQSSLDAPRGGCVYSAGNIELVNSIVRGCRARGFPGGTYEAGGAVYANGLVKLLYSQVLDSIVHRGYGAAVFAGDTLTISHSRICRNQIQTGSGITFSYNGLDARFITFCDNQGGGLDVQGGIMSIADSTVTGNVGGVSAWFGYPSGSMSIVNSTISGNTGFAFVMDGKSPKSIVNSTIAFNELADDESTNCDAPGAPFFVSGPEPVLLDSTIISNNACNGVPGFAIEKRADSQTTVTGANNLLTGGSNMPLPADTITADPQLVPLADNGGPTMTHALPADSPAIDNGNNEAGLEFDQRGKGHPRVKGLQADIGAYER